MESFIIHRSFIVMPFLAVGRRQEGCGNFRGMSGLLVLGRRNKAAWKQSLEGGTIVHLCF